MVVRKGETQLEKGRCAEEEDAIDDNEDDYDDDDVDDESGC